MSENMFRLQCIGENLNIFSMDKEGIKLDAPTPWGLFFQDSATPQMWSGKSLAGV